MHMVVIFSFFDAKVGPTNLLSIPSDIGKEIGIKIARLLEQSPRDDEILVNDFKSFGMKVFTLHVSVPSKWARGHEEIAEISVLTRIEDAPSKRIESLLHEFKKNILARDDVYKAFYRFKMKMIDPDLELAPDPGDIKDAYDFLFDECKKLYRGIATGLPPTHGCISKTTAIATGDFPVPRWLVNEMQKLLINGLPARLFIVYRKDSDGAISIKMIPTAKRVIKVIVKMKQLVSTQILEIGRAINLPLLFTTGICRELEKNCFYEGYFEYDDPFETIEASITGKLKELEFVENVMVSRISED